MYCRTITFTVGTVDLPLIEAVAKTSEEGEYNRFLMRANNNSGRDRDLYKQRVCHRASGVLRALQALNEQAMAKIGVPEGDPIRSRNPEATYCGSSSRHRR